MVHSLALKWPNDVLAGGRKLAGILCERHGDNAIAGIGVNVRQREFPSEIANRATSLALLGSEARVAEVRDAVLNSLSQVVAAWCSGFSAIYPRLMPIDYLAGRQIVIRQLDDSAPQRRSWRVLDEPDVRRRGEAMSAAPKTRRLVATAVFAASALGACGGACAAHSARRVKRDPRLGDADHLPDLPLAEGACKCVRSNLNRESQGPAFCMKCEPKRGEICYNSRAKIVRADRRGRLGAGFVS